MQFEIVKNAMTDSTPAAPQPPFCTNCGNAVAKQAIVCMSCGARPFEHKKFCRQCSVKLNPEQVICIQCGTFVTGFDFVGASPADTAKKLNTYFKVMWITLVVALVASPFYHIAIGLAFGVITLIVSLVYCCMLHYQLWKLIPRDIARTTPGIAVGFLFIPFFNFYWCFVSYFGLSKDLNKTLRQRGISHQVSEGLGLSCAIFSVLSWVALIDDSILSVLITVAGCIVCIFFYKSVKDGAIALLEQEQ